MTNCIFWLMTYYVALSACKLSMFCVEQYRANIAEKKAADVTQRPLQSLEPHSPTGSDSPPPWDSVATSVIIVKKKDEEKDSGSDSRDASPGGESGSPSASDTPKKSGKWSMVTSQYPSIVSFLLIFAVGAPVAAGTGDSRFLDGCFIWFFWISAVRGQRCFKQSKFFPKNPRCKSAVSTLLNPVLITVLFMLAYTRAKASALGVAVSWVLDEFSQGSPLYAIWTAGATGNRLDNNRASYFGAGDLALSILEVGILIWGFKLFECRRQLFSAAGIVTVVISIAVAAANVYLSVLLGVVCNLDAPEALAFAARSTTLALAKPAIEAVGGNVPANAGLVVANGILGQVLYPFALPCMGIKKEADATQPQGSAAEGRALLNKDTADATKPDSPPRSPIIESTPDLSPPTPIAFENDPDDAITIAAGIAIGINGAAMGVAYLVENKSRAAPYAALAMTIFGVFTVVFTTVQPFTAALIALARKSIHA